MPSVLQTWVQELSFMQQSVIISAMRGPDGLHKDHVSKLLIRWLRRCTLYSAFDKEILSLPYDPDQKKGGSFTGPSVSISHVRHKNIQNKDKQSNILYWHNAMFEVLENYIRSVDEVPHHFQLHFMHAAEIIGYKHPDDYTREWWHKCYLRLVNDMHLNPETEEQMDRRLGDNEQNWRAAEEVTAKQPGEK